MVEPVLKRFEAADETSTFELGRFEVVHLGGVTVGRASYEPGWIWSRHVGSLTGERWCRTPHVGLVVSGRNRVTMEDGRTIDMEPGDLFQIAPGHDSAVVGDEPYVSLHFVGADRYGVATREPIAPTR
ncbi:MAG: cupin [Chloroflexi bacterium GWC2_73_18]|nr:MAG: cupin [Chloroflexi bacterium GWC2_73_18]